jgi:hypothetical protein
LHRLAGLAAPLFGELPAADLTKFVVTLEQVA